MRRGITRLLRDYYELLSKTEFDGDYDTAIILADLLGAVNSETLTARQRQFIALYYFVGLTFSETAEIVGVDVRNAKEGVHSAIRRLEANMADSTTFKSRTPNTFADKQGEVYRWLERIANGEEIKEPSRKVVLSIADILRYTDDESEEMIRQVSEGFVNVYVDDVEEYPHYSDSQLRWLDRRVSLVEEVLPVGDSTGFKRHRPAPDYEGNASEDDDYFNSRTVRKTGRRKLFKLRGN